MKGKVKWFDTSRGYGFIESEGADDIFIHYSEIIDPENEFKKLNKGDKVEFDVEEGEKGKSAVDLKIIERMTVAERFRKKGYVRWPFPENIYSESNDKEIKNDKGNEQKKINDFKES